MATPPLENSMSDFTQEQLQSIEDKNTTNTRQDDLGQFPRAEYFNHNNLNYKATGIERNDLIWSAQAEGIELPIDVKINSQYPYNQITETVTGHSFEMDDTPGNERILLKHNKGAGIELCADGSICISSINNTIHVTGGTQQIIVVGDAKMSYQGNLDVDVTGSYTINCLNYNLNVSKNKTETITGAETVTVGKGVSKQVTGSVETYVTQNAVDTILGSKTEIVKNGYDVSVEGSINFATNDDFFATAGDIINLAANNFTASANDMTVQGGSGTIGGTSMLFSGKGAVFEEGVTAPTFHGDLTGRADEAIASDTAVWAARGGGVGGPDGWTNTNTATPTITKPTATNVLSFLTKAAGGIKKVVIDKGNHIKRFIDPRDDYGGL